ncbi:hypothetical protein C5E07_04400 [Pseudoclavibacter sp. RFBJ3]|uniref:hypothetical protein n=1 Tax=unclassified Pseudoclavibacter TaxID=2615177 RepID=UPI000CE8A551|nr:MULTISPECIES: hypothetical protein [unclassified Pseudoclavibacter]MBF4549723.1 hypothetical protein [Pseudoclavibacter sp. VKM Ac-2888]PPF39776.1 hypothetical protein C5E05_00735 [Pseudoclavibacter sp. AY1H1]PPF84759.1 hypothetical protein C5C12_05105 [Pseudoclavibacter sp. RFBJ5]PPF93762.1 hypothetical protein C5E07_04400 [Pseudoclavibacter sp. RFBJ3]PPF98479.1 hypothetical protein C5C19_07385 [Pseudoclavibacter sp. RFBH5]
MPTYAVLLKYEVVSALVIEAESEDEAAKIANEFESEAHDAVEDTDDVRVSSRLWGDGTLEVQSASDDEAAEDLLDEWIDEIESELEDSDEDDDLDEVEAELDPAGDDEVDDFDITSDDEDSAAKKA